MRHDLRPAVPYALKSDANETLSWLQNQPPGRSEIASWLMAIEHLEEAERESWTALFSTENQERRLVSRCFLKGFGE